MKRLLLISAVICLIVGGYYFFSKPPSLPSDPLKSLESLPVAVALPTEKVAQKIFEPQVKTQVFDSTKPMLNKELTPIEKSTARQVKTGQSILGANKYRAKDRRDSGLSDQPPLLLPIPSSSTPGGRTRNKEQDHSDLSTKTEMASARETVQHYDRALTTYLSILNEVTHENN